MFRKVFQTQSDVNKTCPSSGFLDISCSSAETSYFLFFGGRILKSFWVIYGGHFEDAAQPACLKEKKMSFTVFGEKLSEDFSFEDVTNTTDLDGNI